MTTPDLRNREVSWRPSFYRGVSYCLDPVGNRLPANSTLPESIQSPEHITR